mmetsp:Transcript_92267/g.232044  ORF Transcript_92267/g.232044 Transcript_92267/m.232044 type:complete len:213 (+) Transcript_92267:1217-1855(+)
MPFDSSPSPYNLGSSRKKFLAHAPSPASPVPRSSPAHCSSPSLHLSASPPLPAPPAPPPHRHPSPPPPHPLSSHRHPPPAPLPPPHPPPPPRDPAPAPARPPPHSPPPLAEHHAHSPHPSPPPPPPLPHSPLLPWLGWSASSAVLCSFSQQLRQMPSSGTLRRPPRHVQRPPSCHAGAGRLQRPGRRPNPSHPPAGGRRSSGPLDPVAETGL